jgi:hypothetical protein
MTKEGTPACEVQYQSQAFRGTISSTARSDVQSVNGPMTTSLRVTGGLASYFPLWEIASRTRDQASG